jgi:hypothetical protein
VFRGVIGVEPQTMGLKATNELIIIIQIIIIIQLNLKPPTIGAGNDI